MCLNDKTKKKNAIWCIQTWLNFCERKHGRENGQNQKKKQTTQRKKMNGRSSFRTHWGQIELGNLDGEPKVFTNKTETRFIEMSIDEHFVGQHGVITSSGDQERAVRERKSFEIGLSANGNLHDQHKRSHKSDWLSICGMLDLCVIKTPTVHRRLWWLLMKSARTLTVAFLPPLHRKCERSAGPCVRASSLAFLIYSRASCLRFINNCVFCCTTVYCCQRIVVAFNWNRSRHRENIIPSYVFHTQIIIN